MRILVVAEYFHPVIGGAEIVLWNICKELAARGHHVQVITSRLENTTEHEKIEGIEIYRPIAGFDISRNRNLSTILAMMRRVIFAIKLFSFLNKYCNENQVDFIYNIAYVPTIASTWVAYLKKIPCITAIGCFGGVTNFHIYNPLIATLYCLFEIFVLLFGKHTAIRCASSGVARKVQKYTSAPVVCIPSPIDEVQIRRIKENANVEGLRQKLGIKKDEYFLLFVGVLSSVKNVDGLIKTVSKLKINYKLVIVGDGPEKNKIEKIINKLFLHEKIILLGKKDHFETLKIMKACDILILPSKSEVFPTVVIEALALGRPVITTDVGGVSEIKSPNLYIIKSVEEIDDQMIQTIKPEFDESVINQCSAKSVIDEFVQLFRRIIDKKVLKDRRDF